jgi:tetratricopeptide (TPR) repeat protein
MSRLCHFSRPQTRLGLVLAVALLLRLGHGWMVRDQPFFAQLAMDSQEYDRWARQIAAGDWLGSEVFFQAPLYPYALAVLYALGGSVWTVYLVQILFAIAGLWALYRAGHRMGGDRVGLAAAALGALYGPFLFYDVQLLKESAAVAVASFLLWALAARRWLVAGLLAGVLILLRENMLLVVPFLLPLAWRGEIPWKRFLKAGAVFLVGCVLPLAPVAWRNHQVGGGFLPTTFQGGVNFYIGNNPRADGTYQPIVPGKQIPALERREPVRIAEQESGRKLAPAEVSRFWLRKSLAWAREHPGDFLRLQLRKLLLFWSWYEQPDAVDYYYVRTLSPVLWLPLVEFGTIALLALAGLVLLRGRVGRCAPALLFALGWMVSTVVFFLFSRYRLPVVPALLLLAAVPIDRTIEAWKRGDSRRALFAALLIVVAWALPRWIRYEPRMDLVEYNLGRLAEEADRPQEAAGHYAAALAANPQDFLSAMNLGNLAARSGAFPTALGYYTRAAELEPRSDDVQSNLGGVYLALDRLPEADEHLARALELNPGSLAALHNRALLALRAGDPQRAWELTARILELEPGNPAALRLRERMKAVPIY